MSIILIIIIIIIIIIITIIITIINIIITITIIVIMLMIYDKYDGDDAFGCCCRGLADCHQAEATGEQVVVSSATGEWKSMGLEKGSNVVINNAICTIPQSSPFLWNGAM